MLTKASVLEASSYRFRRENPETQPRQTLVRDPGPSELRLELVASDSWARALPTPFPSDLFSRH